MKIGVTKEIISNESRVALVPSIAAQLIKRGFEVLVETGAGVKSGFSDTMFETVGAHIVSKADLFKISDILLTVQGFIEDDIHHYRKGQVVIGLFDPLNKPTHIADLAKTGATFFSMELIPRITRAQSMDVLSSMATIAGYKAVLLAAEKLPKLFPMMMTAAGTITPAKVFIVGAGVAGLQAIATAKRLGAVVTAYDLRPAAREQVESVGGKFIELELDSDSSEDSGGYAKEMDEQFYQKQREMMKKIVGQSDVVITTAAIPGKKAPILITEEMVNEMASGSVVVDLAAERGGNCALTKLSKVVMHNGVAILGPDNLPATVPFHASQMYAKNIATFLDLLISNEGELIINHDDEIISHTLLTHEGNVVNEKINELLKTYSGEEN